MLHDIILFTTEMAAVAHVVMAIVLFYFARRSVRYLSQAWIMLLMGVMYGGIFFCVMGRVVINPGILHPGMLLFLLTCSYLQSIYPLGIAMPGYLQWGRMWRYAAPAIAIIAIYLAGALLGSNVTRVYQADDLPRQFLSGDVILRFLALILSFYYIANIFILPHRLVRRMELPRDQVFYGTLLGLIAVLFVFLTIDFNRPGFVAYVLLSTAIDLFLSFRILRPVLDDMALPKMKRVATPPADAELLRSTEDDFNEANRQRFARMEYYMQTERPFTDPSFTRDTLCRHTGFNRHLVLQSLRSQGYNDVHEYISRYRAGELRRLLEAGQLLNTHDTERCGFRTFKTAVLAFARYEDGDLQEAMREAKEEREQRSKETDVKG